MTPAPRELTVAVVQSGGTSPDRTTAIADLLVLFEEAAAPGVDVVIFPELCTTPYFGATDDAQYRDWAQSIPGPDTDAFAGAARRLGVGVIFGLFERAEDGTGYNSAVIIDATGALVSGTDLAGASVSSYRKMSIPQNQLGATAVNEKFFFDPGAGTVIFEAFGTRIACLICYDRTFPEYWLAARAAGAEVVVALVSSMGSRETLFVPELQVRAMETQVWVIAPNRGGEETINGTTTSYFGRSCIVGPVGVIVAEASPHISPEVLTQTIDLGEVAAVRESFPLARDRRSDVFQYLASAHALSGATLSGANP